MGTQTIKGLATGDLCVSLLHGKMVRIAGVEPDGFVRVADKDTGRELADLVNPQQIQTPAERLQQIEAAWRRKAAG